MPSVVPPTPQPMPWDPPAPAAPAGAIGMMQGHADSARSPLDGSPQAGIAGAIHGFLGGAPVPDAVAPGITRFLGGTTGPGGGMPGLPTAGTLPSATGGAGIGMVGSNGGPLGTSALGGWGHPGMTTLPPTEASPAALPGRRAPVKRFVPFDREAFLREDA